MPKISVILPVYNAEKYLREAIDSILSQTFADFELLLINDGSTDGSEAIILSYTDSRIVYVKNDVNQGLIFSLNKGIDIAKGEYIARMDADDISMPMRLEKQLCYLENNPVDMLATTIKVIDKDGAPLPYWKQDVENITTSQIRSFLPKNNCVAHPTVMAKASLFKKYRYQPDATGEYKYVHNQKYSEDYDLWLRLLATGLLVDKLPEPLLFYRELSTSVTRYRKVNIFFRLASVKFRFVCEHMKTRRPSLFVLSVFLYACIDVIKGGGKELKASLKTEKSNQ